MQVPPRRAPTRARSRAPWSARPTSVTSDHLSRGAAEAPGRSSRRGRRAGSPRHFIEGEARDDAGEELRHARARARSTRAACVVPAKIAVTVPRAWRCSTPPPAPSRPRASRSDSGYRPPAAAAGSARRRGRRRRSTQCVRRRPRPPASTRAAAARALECRGLRSRCGSSRRPSTTRRRGWPRPARRRSPSASSPRSWRGGRSRRAPGCGRARTRCATTGCSRRRAGGRGSRRRRRSSSSIAACSTTTWAIRRRRCARTRSCCARRSSRPTPSARRSRATASA